MKQMILVACLASATGWIGSAFAEESRPIRIGVMNDQSGVYADTGGIWSVAAAKMAVEDFGGSVIGLKIDVLSGDHQNSTDIGAALARRWYDVDSVDMIEDVPNSSIALAVHALSKEKKKIDIIVGGGTTRLSGDSCQPYGFEWAYDTHALAVGTGSAVIAAGGKDWAFLTADYAFGYALESDTRKVIESHGGKVLGTFRHPLGISDFSSFLLQAQATGAKVIGLADAGLDAVNAIKQAVEFGITAKGQKLAALLLTLNDVHGLGLQMAQGTMLTESFYWDRDEKSRAFSQRFFARTKRMPNMHQAAAYSATLHYLKAIREAGTRDTEAVTAMMHKMPVDDMFVQNGKILANGRLVKDMYLFEVKSPAESKAPWDYYKLVATIPGEEAYLSAAESGCPYTK